MKSRFWIFNLFFALFFISCSTEEIQKYEDSRFMFGTYIKITIYSKNQKLAHSAMEKAFDEIERIDKKFNSKTKGSLIYEVNNSDKKILKVDSETKEIFDKVREMYELSNKKYDITIGPLVKLWGFTEEKLYNENEILKLPTTEEIAQIKNKIDFGAIKFENDKLLLKENIEIDTGSFLKGYAISKASKVIKKNGIDKAFITAISSLNTIGTKPENMKWKIGLQNPENPQELLGVVSFADKAMGVSGDYQTYIEIDGKKYHHILDKDTGYPVEDKKMVVVIAGDTFLADLYSTVFFLMPIQEILNYVEKNEGIEVLIVDKDMKIIKSDNFIFKKMEK